MIRPRSMLKVATAGQELLPLDERSTFLKAGQAVEMGDGQSFVIADIPGLIEGAHTGAGLGHEFLRHTERTRLILHVLDISGSEERDPLEDLRLIQEELRLYSADLALRPVVIVANKMDIPGAEDQLERLKEAVGDSCEIFPVSAANGEGLKALIYRIAQLLPETPVPELLNLPVDHLVTKVVESEKRFEILKDEDLFIVTGKEVERHVKMTFFEREASVWRFQNILKAMGIDEALRKQGIKEGDKVEIADTRFDWV